MSDESYSAARCLCGKVKVRYGRRAHAHQVASRLRREGNAGIHPYRCPKIPGVWHIGHRPGTKRA